MAYLLGFNNNIRCIEMYFYTKDEQAQMRLITT